MVLAFGRVRVLGQRSADGRLVDEALHLGVAFYGCFLSARRSGHRVGALCVTTEAIWLITAIGWVRRGAPFTAGPWASSPGMPQSRPAALSR